MYWNKIAGGILEVELTSAEMESALTRINAEGIHLMRLKYVGDLTCRFHIRGADYPIVSKLCQKRGENLRIVKRKGVYWHSYGLKRRSALLMGMLALILLVVFLPTRVLFIRVEGNIAVPERQILAAAEDCGIHFGAARRAVRSEKMKNALLSALPQLQWAGINTTGCTAVISVREREQYENMQEEGVSKIIANRDGYILSGTVTRGNGLFQPGDTVREGQVLISGYTDCGICIRATRAEGVIYAQTNRNFSAVVLSDYGYKMEEGEIKHAYSLIVRKKRINLWKDSGISDSSCGRMYKEYYITLPGGFQLPIAFCVETYVDYSLQTQTLSSREAEIQLSQFANQYLPHQMIAGEITGKKEMVRLNGAVFRLYGQYTCVEMIGREVMEQIGESNGKTG